VNESRFNCLCGVEKREKRDSLSFIDMALGQVATICASRRSPTKQPKGK
jgi:hypothetical protein